MIKEKDLYKNNNLCIHEIKSDFNDYAVRFIAPEDVNVTIGDFHTHIKGHITKTFANSEGRQIAEKLSKNEVSFAICGA